VVNIVPPSPGDGDEPNFYKLPQVTADGFLGASSLPGQGSDAGPAVVFAPKAVALEDAESPESAVRKLGITSIVDGNRHEARPANLLGFLLS